MDVSHLSTLKTPTSADNVLVLNQLSALSVVNKQLKKINATAAAVMLGGGANILFTQSKIENPLVLNALRGVRVDVRQDNVYVTALAGENWHDFVLDMSERGFYGLENLALIPGTVGAAPVQNIGAYGVEVADLIAYVEVYDCLRDKLLRFDKTACQFAYRDSLFKKNPHYWVTAVTFLLSKRFCPQLHYAGLVAAEIDSSKKLIETIIRLRQQKLPNPKQIPNAGSFFKNPVVDKKTLARLLTSYPDMPHFAYQNAYKLSAAWLLEQAGCKGFAFQASPQAQAVYTYKQHALIVINPDFATGENIMAFADYLIAQVLKTFNVRLYPEVQFI